MLARIRSVTAGTRSTISCSAWLSGSPLLTFSAVASGSVTAPMSASIAATSTSHASSQPVSVARSAISRLTRPARPKAAGLASASTSVRAWMLPRSVCSSSVALGAEHLVLPERCGARALEVVAPARLGQEAEDLALVDGLRGRIGVRVTGEQHAHRARRHALASRRNSAPDMPGIRMSEMITAKPYRSAFSIASAALPPRATRTSNVRRSESFSPSRTCGSSSTQRIRGSDWLRARVPRGASAGAAVCMSE